MCNSFYIKCKLLYIDKKQSNGCLWPRAEKGIAKKRKNLGDPRNVLYFLKDGDFANAYDCDNPLNCVW